MNKDHTLHTKEEILDILRLLSMNGFLTQRELSTSLGISVGKTNYLLKLLIKGNLVEVQVSDSNGHKAKKVRYVVTDEGLRQKVNLANHLLKKKEKEYLKLREEVEKVSQTETSDNKVCETIE